MQPGDGTTLRDVAGLLVDSGRAAQAIPYLRELVEKTPADLVRRQQLGETLMASGQPAEAAALFWYIVERMPEAVVARVWLADAQARQGYADAAVKTVQDGLALDPKVPVLHRALGVMLEKAGKGKEAASAYRKYAELAPNEPDAKELQARANQLDPPGGAS
jgi:Flp pilus assembly protein TadD